MLRVLYIHHCPVFGGASKSLMEAIRAIKPNQIEPIFIVPSSGNVKNIFSEYGWKLYKSLGISQFDHTYSGHYRGARWGILLREIMFLIPTFLAIWRVKRNERIDLIHVNEVTQIPSIIFSKLLFPKVPIILHVRCLMKRDTPLRTKLINAIVDRYVDKYVAIDESVQRTLDFSIPGEIIHNGFSPKQFDLSKKTYNSVPTITYVSNLLVSKGILDLLQAIKICSERKIEAKFIILGAAPRRPRWGVRWLLKLFGFYFDIETYVKDYIREKRISSLVDFRGFDKNIDTILETSEVITFPSHLNALGRPIFEAAFYGCPSLVTTRDELPSDVFVDGFTGVRKNEKNPRELADGIEFFVKNPHEVIRMGQNAHDLAWKNFDIHKNAESLLSLYRNVLGMN